MDNVHRQNYGGKHTKSSECASNTAIDTLQVSYSCRLAFAIEA